MKTIHALILGIAAFAAGLPSISDTLPPVAAPYMKAAQAMLIVVGAVLSTLDAPPSSALARKS